MREILVSLLLGMILCTGAGIAITSPAFAHELRTPPNAVVPEVTSCPLKIPLVQVWRARIASPNMAFYVENHTDFSYELSYKAQFDTDSGPIVDTGQGFLLTAMAQTKAWVMYNSTNFYVSYGNWERDEHPRLVKITITCSPSSPDNVVRKNHPTFWEAKSLRVQRKPCPFIATQARLWNGDDGPYLSLYVYNLSPVTLYADYTIQYTDRDGFSNTVKEDMEDGLIPEADGWYAQKTRVSPRVHIDSITVGCYNPPFGDT